MTSPYVVLDVAEGASPAAIRKAYRRQVFKHHPDRNPNDPNAAERLRLAAAAYERLQKAGWYLPPSDSGDQEDSAATSAQPTRPEYWWDGEPIHYPTDEEVDELFRGSNPPRLQPGKQILLFFGGLILLYYLLESLRGGDDGDGFAPRFYYEQNKRHYGP